ncbi:MAG: glycine cleavage system aminomethyltransferase GcvT [Alphaproteobacteria bacterium]|nr:glycine cleavage system aminomethyltransferase GcvT [Alphaproteobacteria bacterium]
MADVDVRTLRETVLHEWHAKHGGKMVDFAGWDMPVQYETGTIQEHLATRRHAGLFDVSHMGRYEITGPGAEDFLLGVLTNDARALATGQAQYTFIPNEAGGAVDDAYLYKLGETRFLLVVNAGNREKDWRWLNEHKDAGEMALTDVSEDLGMMALQGPHATAILEQVVAKAELPENKRNRLSVTKFEGGDLIVARSGYTGESVCFELFPETGKTVALWERLVALGAEPVGLGARDSLRLEAGLPLYGHELGRDPEDREIPIFANALALFAVRHTDTHDYVGRAALEAQREEFIHIRRGELDVPTEARLLKRLVLPIAGFAGRKPLRAGFKVLHEGEDVGYVTSGTSVPYTRFYGEGHTATPSEDHDLRPIGLALVDSGLRYRTDRPVVLDILDDRGKSFEVELVEKNLWPTAPYARPYTGFAGPRRLEPLDAAHADDLAARLVEEAAANTHWRRRECINLIPSEQTASAYVDRLCTADPAGRYNEHSRLKALGPDAPELRYYKGTAFIMEKEEELKAALRAFFGCARAEVRVISGQMANDTVYDGLKQFKNRGRRGHQSEPLRRVLVHDLNKGGHLSAQPMGALRNYVAVDPVTGRPAVEHFPIQSDNPHRIDVEPTKALIQETRPELIVFGRSVIIHREPVAEIASFIHDEFGFDNPRRPFIMYDGAHVLGLLGPHYQDPLAEGADIVTGSTHKTFFGPQRGVILANIAPGSPFEELWRLIESRAFPGHVSNHHLGTMLGLLGATYEMLRFKDDYQKHVIENAKALALALMEQDLEIEGDRACGFTETHQVLLRTARAKGEYAADLLEANNIITNPQAFHDDPSFAAASGVRMGSQEMTRHGMGPDDFRNLAGLIAEILRDGADKPRGHWQEKVREVRSGFTEMRYCFD